MSTKAIAKAELEKKTGNEAFEKNEFEHALSHFTLVCFDSSIRHRIRRSIEIYPTIAAYSNRALLLIKMKRFEEAEKDANTVTCIVASLHSQLDRFSRWIPRI